MFIRNIRDTLRQLGLVSGLLYLLARLLSRASGDRIRLVRYLLVAQPVPLAGQTLLRPPSNSPVRTVGADDPIVVAFPRPPEVIARRFKDGALCLVAESRSRFTGFLWLAFDHYEEDEVRCRYMFARPEASVWDYDVYVEPEFGIGRSFSRLWDAANTLLAEQGIRWSFSRISAFNPASLAAHRRLGIRTLFPATFLCIGQIQIALVGTRPYLHISMNPQSRPVLLLTPPEDI